MDLSTFFSSRSPACPRTVVKNCSLTLSFCTCKDNFSSCYFFLLRIYYLPASSISYLSVFYFFSVFFSSYLTSRAKELGFDGSNLLICIALFLVPDWSPFFVNLSTSFEFTTPDPPLLWAFEEVRKTSFAGTI
jgi:hypothetical protein